MSKLRGRRPFVFRLRTSLALGLALASIEAAAYEYPVRIIREDKGSAVQLSIANDGLVPVTVVIELTSSSNTGFSPAVIGSKFPHLVFPGQTRRITTAVPLKIGRDARFAYQYRFAFGDPQARHRSDQLYRLPIPDGVRGVVRAYTGAYVSNSFVNTSNASEVVLPAGTPIVAARDGVVINGRGFKNAEIDTPLKPSPIGNFVSILHEDGTWATYGWLADRSVIPSPGTTVKSGEVIGVSDRNPDAFETYIVFLVNRNYFGMNLRGVPLKIIAAGDQIIEPSTFTGQVSPNLQPRYARTDDEPPWYPSEKLVPGPKPPVDWDDEHLTPTQRQVLFRQRMLEAAEASETVAGSRPLIFLAMAAAAMGSLGALVALSTHGSSKPAGVRGFIWALLRSKPPSGDVPQDLVEDPSRFTVKPTGPITLFRGGDDDDVAGEETGEPSPAAEHESKESPAGDAADASAEEAPDPDSSVDEAEHLRPRSIMSPEKAKLLSLITSLMPSSCVCAQSVELTELVDGYLPADAADLEVDFVVVDKESGVPRLAILYVPEGVDAQASMLLSQRLSIAAIPTVTFDKTPKPAELKSRLKRLL